MEKFLNKNQMRIIFIGSSKSSKYLLKHCLKLKLNIVGIITKKKSWNSDFVDLSKIYLKKKYHTFTGTKVWVR